MKLTFDQIETIYTDIEDGQFADISTTDHDDLCDATVSIVDIGEDEEKEKFTINIYGAKK